MKGSKYTKDLEKRQHKHYTVYGMAKGPTKNAERRHAWSDM